MGTFPSRVTSIASYGPTSEGYAMSRSKIIVVGGVSSFATGLLLSFLSVRASGATVITSTVIPSALTARAGGMATAQAVSPLVITDVPGTHPSGAGHG